MALDIQLWLTDMDISSFPSLTANEQKKLLRKDFLKKRENITFEEKALLDGKIIKSFTSLSCYITSDTILLYYPIKGEIDILKIAELALSQKKKIAFPRCSKEKREMTFHTVKSLSELEAGEYGIPEPPSNAPILQNACAALCIVPGLAFDRDGFRLGYGGGYYDRFLDTFDGISAALVYDAFLLQELPADEYDMPVDIIITDKEVFSPDVV